MEMSVREARAGFAAAIAAAERGERVTITKNGKAVAELGPPVAKKRIPWNWEDLDRLQEELGIARQTSPRDLKIDWAADHAWSREVLGIDDSDGASAR